MSVRPAETTKSAEAEARPLRSWIASEAALTQDGRLKPAPQGLERPLPRSLRRPHLAHDLVVGLVILAVGVLPVDHHALAVLDGRTADVGTHRRLVVDRTERHLAEGGINVEVAQFGWRKRYRDEAGAPAVRSASQLIPVVVTAEPPAVVPQPSTAAAAIEFDLAGKYRVRVGVDAQALRRVLDVLERR